MQCPRKAVILLLVFIVIQYTAIKTFIGKPFQMLPIPNLLNCGLVQEAKPSERVSDPNLSHKVPRKTHILILATARSGSSFVGQLFNQHWDIFYLFEPLYHVHTTLLYPQAHMPGQVNAADQRWMLGPSRDLLRSLYSCDLSSLEGYIKQVHGNHTTNKLFRQGASRALCSPPVCTAFGLCQTNIAESDCAVRCPTLNLSLAADSCMEHQHVAIKTVRVQEVNDLRPLFEDPQLNLKVIQLVRDPRGILSSRIDTFRKAYWLWWIWAATGQKPQNLPVTQLTTICDDFLSSVSTAMSRPPWLKGRYMLVRYEDLALNPLQRTKEIYDFLGLAMDKNVVDWIQKNTRGSSQWFSRGKYSTMRNSAANAESWRYKLPYDIVKYTQTACQQILQELGYKTVISLEELTDRSVSLIEDKKIDPFL
ncbi:carbohydrate sulfotransferase 1-like [Sardina pilchardus]|uniref:carbohydrate sulfotransferase 1-like n=1 Tax=Sardina pilchardus TaxID=27697 RepID=UPI002E136679